MEKGVSEDDEEEYSVPPGCVVWAFLCKIKVKFFNSRVKWSGIALRKINLTAMIMLNQAEHGWKVRKHDTI